jgi:hypothetical protein
MTPGAAAAYFKQSSGRAALIYVSCFAGMILAAFSRNWFILPFAVLKIIADLAVLFPGAAGGTESAPGTGHSRVG